MAYAETNSPSALDPEQWKHLKVTKRDSVNHNTVSLRLAFDEPDQVAGLPVASCILTRAPIGSKKEDGSTAFVIRPYTPVSEPNSKYSFVPCPPIHVKICSSAPSSSFWE